MTVDYRTYNDSKTKFFRKHKNDYHTETSAIDQYGTWHKEYTFSDGAVWYERYSSESEEVQLTGVAHLIGISETKIIKLFKTEFWNTDEAASKFLYEKF